MPAKHALAPRSSQFYPAARVEAKPSSKVRAEPREEEIEEEVEEEAPRYEARIKSGIAPRGEQQAERLTKAGYPDRRFKGQRDLPPPEEINPEFRRARVGGTVGNIHVTMTGKPDLRFKENRSVSPEEAEIRMARAILEKYSRAGKI